MDDKALQELINEIENDEKQLIHAPSYLKTQILEAVEETALPKRKRKLLLYSLEVGAMTAAAIALLLFSPFGTGSGRLDTDGKADDRAQTVAAITEKASDITRKVVTFGSVMMPDRDNLPVPYDYDDADDQF
ncbi:MAG: hypothetical protein IJ930_04290 [Lachnospiraceae bacterium]|nr:hypothetical protein [Lachnospiraceae bacterium]